MQSNDSKNKVGYKSLEFMGYLNYRVGDDGSVWRWIKSKDVWKRLKLASDKAGYVIVSLCHNGKAKTFKVHTLVLLAFIGLKPLPNMECRHYPDRNRSNNNLANLSWSSEKVNQGDRNEHGTHNKGENNYSAKLTEFEVLEMRRMFDSGKCNERELRELFKTSKSQTNKIVNRKVWTHI